MYTVVLRETSQPAADTDTGAQALTATQDKAGQNAQEGSVPTKNWAHLSAGDVVEPCDFMRLHDPDLAARSLAPFYLADAIINPIAKMIELEAGGDVLAFRTQLAQAMLNPMPNPAAQAERMARLRSYFASIDIFDKRLLLLPVIEQVTVGGVAVEHIFTIAIYPKLKVIAAVDSLSAAKTDALNAVRAFLQDEFLERARTEDKPAALFDWCGWHTASLCRRTPAQTDGCSCGIYALLTMRALARRVSLQEVLRADRISAAPSYWRRRFALWLTIGKII